MFKNKKIVLSSIAIVFALVVSSIFVNYTLANSDSQTSAGTKSKSGSTTSLTGLSNIDLAIENSNNAGKKQTGEDKYRILQIVPDSYSGNAAKDTELTAKVTDPKFTGDAKKLDGYDSTTYLWRYVYAGEYFRLAVFNGYKTIEANMAEGAVTLTTCTVSELNSMDTNAQGILDQADFIYIWANSASDYASQAADISEGLYNWLDSYATANSHPIAICTGALCTDEPELITGNNDDYRMGSLAYKLITKGAVARFDNVLVTAPDFFKTLYEEADNNKTTPDINKTTYTLSDFILKAERKASEGGSDYINFGTYYKWYDGLPITDFLDGNVLANMTDSTYDKAGSRSGLTGDRKEWNFDNAKILVISEDGAASPMSSELSTINSSANEGDRAAADYRFNKKTKTWESVQKAPNSELTAHLYANGTASGGTGVSKYVPSGADIYVLDSENLVDALTNGGKPFSNMSLAGSYYMDVQTKSVSGKVKIAEKPQTTEEPTTEEPTTEAPVEEQKKSVSGTVICTDADLDLVDSEMYAYLIAEDGTQLKLAGSSADERIIAPLEAKTVVKTDADGNEVVDEETGEKIEETVYTYSFSDLDPKYNYRVVLGGAIGDDNFNYDDYTLGIAENAGLVDGSETDYQYDFSVKKTDEENLEGYKYRVDADGNTDANIVVSYPDYASNEGVEGLDYTYSTEIAFENNTEPEEPEEPDTPDTPDEPDLNLEDLEMYAYLLVEDGTEIHPAGDADGNVISAPLKAEKVSKLDADGKEVIDEKTGKVVQETIYTYSFEKLNPNYNYRVVIDGAIGDSQFDYDSYTIGISESAGLVDGSETEYQYDFNIKAADQANVAGYKYRTDADGNTDADVVVSYKDFMENVGVDKLAYQYKDDVIDNSIDLSDEDKVAAYVMALHDAYVQTQIPLITKNEEKVTLSDYDFIFIDRGTYNKEIGKTVFDQLSSAVESGQYFIVSSKAGDGKGSGNNGGSDNDGPTIPVVDSPSAKAVADVINASVYRDGSDNKFKVLEIQPDYPIDLSVAAMNDSVGTAYKTRSDGATAITGDYYTVPSDVVSGKSKQELAEKTEYYDFDLTKAKIAYAIDGLSVGDIELTQVSTEKLIGMKEDIAATYDLVYIGGDISAMDRNPAEMYKGQCDIGNATSGYTYQVFPTFIMYYHTGTLSQLQSASTYSPDTAPISGNTELLASPKVGTTYYKTTYLAENGNDLTNTKYQELLTYMASGRPLMVSDELTSVYENMQGLNANGEKLAEAELLQGYWYKNGNLERTNYYLDPSSRMYKLVNNIYTRYTGTDGSNILWGFNNNATQYISDKDGKYGNSLWTMRAQSLYDGNVLETDMLDSEAQKQGWYSKPGTDTVYYNYKVVWDDQTSASINKFIAGSAHRARLTVIDKPAKYVQGIEQTYLKTNRLSFTFQVDGDDTSYKFRLYVDVDKNTKFEDSGSDYCQPGTVMNGEQKTVTVPLDQEFFGSAAWYLEVTDSNDNMVAATSGLSKIINNNMSKSEINVLQVQTMAEGQGAKSWQATDTLYFDIESQTAHKIAKYNVFANQTELDQSDTSQYTPLGLHETRFGIYEYDQSTDADDYYSNLADQLLGDYDINLDLVVASADKASFKTGDGKDATYDCLDTMVEEAEKLGAGEKVDGHTQKEYVDLAAVALSEYSAASAKVTTPKKTLDKYIQDAIDYLDGKYTGTKDMSKFTGNFNTSQAETKRVLKYIMETGDYYIIFWPKYNKMNHCEASFKAGKMSDDFGPDFRDYYSAYVKVKDAEIIAKDKYNTYLRRSYGKSFMKNMYSILVLGPSDSFGGFKVDFKPMTCQYILDYVSAGGDLFFFHDSMSPYANAGASNLTKSLLTVVGMNRFHVDITDNVVTYDHPLDLGTYSATSESFTKITYNANGGKMHEDSTEKLHIYHKYWDQGDTDVFKVTQKAGYKDGDSKYGDAYVLLKNFKTQNATIASGLVPLKEAYTDFGVAEFENATLQKDTDVYYLSSKDDTYAKATYTPDGTYTDVKYNSPDSDLYYLTPYANNSTGGAGLLNSINSNIMDVKQAEWALKGKDTKVYVSALAMTALYYNGNMAGATTTLPYVYAQESFKAATAWSQAANQDQSACAETVKAAQLNSGLVTLYPYNISSTLNISGTHQQAYALDLESQNITVWYTLAGSNNSSDAKTRSSKYAADPGDGMEAYYIYTTAYGSGAITYCGSGHSSVTGRRTRNNDERKLFINVIVNSAKAVPDIPTIKCYEPKKTWAAEDELPKDEEALASAGRTVYVREIQSKTDDPTFDYKIGIPENTKISKVNVYYDLDYDDSDYSIRPSYTDGTDKMITSYTSKGTTQLIDVKGDLKEIVRDSKDVKLKADDTCFAPYGGNYTYIVIEVYYQGKTVPAYALIKVKAADPLFDLTDNTIDIPAIGDFIAEKKNMFS